MDAQDFKDLHWLLDVIQSTNIGIVVLDRTLQIEVFNRFMQAHSGVSSERAIGHSITEVFPDLPEQWLLRRMQTVFGLGIPVYMTWEERPYLFRFPMHLPIHYRVEIMYQNVMFVPLRAANDQVERVGIVVHDVTESALTRQALEEARGQLLLLSRTDRLTNLWGRGYWEERFIEEWQRARRSGEKVSLVMFDIDYFKRINDSYGHPTGDEAIRLVARLLKENSRDTDLCGRYGGEEFVAVLPDTDTAGAIIYCERLRESVEASVIMSPDNHPVKFTISIGIAQLDGKLITAQQWLEGADQALYRAKTGGRNQIVVY